MTPKDKAQELFYKMNDNVLLCQPKYFKSANIAKEIALILVDEIINSSPVLPILGDGRIFGEDIELSTKFWNDVKQELELL